MDKEDEVICPKCGNSIDTINTEQSGIKTYVCWVDATGELDYQEEDFYPDCDTITKFTCPICDAVLAESSEDAVKLLLGDIRDA